MFHIPIVNKISRKSAYLLTSVGEHLLLALLAVRTLKAKKIWYELVTVKSIYSKDTLITSRNFSFPDLYIESHRMSKLYALFTIRYSKVSGHMKYTVYSHEGCKANFRILFSIATNCPSLRHASTCFITCSICLFASFVQCVLCTLHGLC